MTPPSYRWFSANIQCLARRSSSKGADRYIWARYTNGYFLCTRIILVCERVTIAESINCMPSCNATCDKHGEYIDRDWSTLEVVITIRLFSPKTSIGVFWSCISSTAYFQRFCSALQLFVPQCLCSLRDVVTSWSNFFTITLNSDLP